MKIEIFRGKGHFWGHFPARRNVHLQECIIHLPHRE